MPTTVINSPASLNDHTGIFTYTVSDISFHPMQQFFTPDEMTELISELQDEVAAANLSSWQHQQFEIQLAELQAGEVGQMELAFFAGDISGTALPVGTEIVEILNFGSVRSILSDSSIYSLAM